MPDVGRVCQVQVLLHRISQPGSGIGRGKGAIGWPACHSRAILPQVANQEAAAGWGFAGTARAPAIAAAAPVVAAIATASPVVVFPTSVPPVVVGHG